MNDASSHDVRVERRGAVEIWTIDRHERMNALSRAVVRQLGRLARAAALEPEVRLVVVTGAGGRAFCAGADLKERQSMEEEEVRDFLALYRASFGYLDRLQKPVIAAIDGVALGGGLELALACDLRVATGTSTFGLVETSIGIIPGAGGTQRLPRVVGEARAKEMILLARRIDANEALRLGLVNHVVPSGASVVDAAIEWARPIVEGAPIALAAALEAIDLAHELPLEAGLMRERLCYERTLASKDRLEGLAAFAEKRKPKFAGQ